MITDVLIIGAGGAGLTAALAAKDAGASVRVLTKEYPTRSQTCMAQGGMNAALGNVSPDSVEEHIQNTLKSAHGQADEEAVRYMCSEAPNAIQWLDEIGVCFSRTADGKIAQRKLGGASAPRACYAQDYTGLKILHTLYERCLKEDIEIHNERYLLDLLTKEDGSICGALILNIRSGELEHHFAKSVVLASGGYSRIYDKYSTNSTASTGDGIAAAARIGAKLLGMEFVQFHPTGLKNSSILISESARGEGGYLLNSKGERFINELAPRDEVSRAINEQILAGEEVYLDIRHLGEEFIDENLPQERKLALLYEKVDPVKDLIPIKAVAHYTMGGIEVDNKSQTSVSGLFACGECANHKVHGANRLGGNSLLEIIVFGREAGKSAAHYTFCDDKSKNERTCKKETNFLDKLKSFSNEIDFYEKRSYVGELFYKKVGIIRKESALLQARKEIQLLKEQLPLMGVKDTGKVYNTNLVEFIEFRNMLDVCEAVVSAALERKESCGAHFVQEEQ
ncbi:FAD-binding protein [Sulfurimonas hydrogeniphila]|uniref:FAD-binding protein n=1 Tax=Sulfurimonas TaxID=202746 RepID=UPI00125F6769|nr:FAD-binding protein [Sulfurimonas hydrogeniphila]